MSAAFDFRASAERHRFTYDEFLRLGDTSVKQELIEGEIYDMASDGARTISWNAAINECLVRSLLGQPYRVIAEKTLRVTDYNAPSPDFWIYPRELALSEVTAATAVLAIEVSDTTLAYDRDVKAPIYAKGGLRDLWIVDCAARETLVFRLAEGGKYSPPMVAKASDPVAALLIPGLSLTLDALDFPAV